MFRPFSLLPAALMVGCASAPQPRESPTTQPTTQPALLPAMQSAPPFVWSNENLIVADSAATATQAPIDKIVPWYPPDARAHGVEAAFVTAVIIDTLGRAELPSVSFVGTVPTAFARVVCAFYEAARFTPVRDGGSAKRVLNVHPWTFGLTGGEWEHKTIDERPVRERLLREGPAGAIEQIEPLPHCGAF